MRWFGAKGDGNTDDTSSVHRARDSAAFARNGTLYFPIGTYLGAFVFDFEAAPNPSDPPLHNETNIIGDGHGTILMSVGSGAPVVTLGYRTIQYPSSNWMWSRISNLTIIGRNPNFGHQPTANGIEFSNPNDPSLDTVAGRWVLERILFMRCGYGVYKKYGNIGNHYIDCTFSDNTIGVFAQAVEGQMHSGCDRYSGGHFDSCVIAGVQYAGDPPQVIMDGIIFENNGGAWAIMMSCLGKPRMTWSGICLRNLWFENNGRDGMGGDLNIEGLRSVRIDDCGITGKIRLVDASINLYNCRISSDAGGATSDTYHIDKTSSLVAYEHRYDSYPTSKVFVNSISYDGSQDIIQQNWQPTSVWGPLRSVTSTRSSIIVTNQFDTFAEPFTYQSGGSGTISTYVNPMRVLGRGSGRLYLPAGRHIRSDNVVGYIEEPVPKYVVWSMHVFLQSEVTSGHDVNELHGDIFDDYTHGGRRLGYVYFKHNQWACSYGMKLIDARGEWRIVLDFKTAFDATFCITDYQIIFFDDLQSANSYVNSREFTIWRGD